MLALPFQRGISPPGLSASLRNFIDLQYDGDSKNKFDADIQSYTQVRESAIACVETVTASSVQHLLRLHKHMEEIVPRLVGYESELRLSFTWFDAFKPSKKAVSTSVYFDWACFLWNYAALECRLGSHIDRSSEDGIRTANKHFQAAASALEYIIENLYPHIRGETVSGLTDEGLRMALQLMLAQGQLCFYEKSVKDRKAGNMKAGVIARLAAQTALYYEAASRLCKIGAVASYVDPSWASHTEFQYKCFQGAMEYWQAQSAKEVALQKGSGYAEEISRLIRAESYLKQATAIAQKARLGLTLTNGADSLLRTIISTRTTAESDNRTVYMEAVPPDHTLTNVAPVSMVKSTAAVPDLTGFVPSEQPLFQPLLPKAVRKISTEGRDTMNAIASKATAVATEATNSARATLSATGLPGSLESYKSGGELPENLWLKIQRVQALGGVQELQSKFEYLENTAQRAMLSMSNIDESIMREEQADNSYRQRYPDCDSVSSARLNADIKTNNLRMREAFSNARSSDADLERELNDQTFLSIMGILSKTKEEVSQLLPKPQAPLIDFSDFGAPSIGGINSLIDTSTLEGKLLEMAALIEEREAILAELQEIVKRDVSEQIAAFLTKPLTAPGSTAAAAAGGDGGGGGTTSSAAAIVPAVVAGAGGVQKAEGGGDSAVEQAARAAVASIAFTAEMRARAIEVSVERQTSLLHDIATANDAFIRDRQNDPGTMDRDRIIKLLEQGISRFFAAHSQLVAGATFYSNLQSRLTTILQSSDDLSYTQTLMRQEFESKKADEYERREQELRDREYALRVNAEMEALASNAAATSALSSSSSSSSSAALSTPGNTPFPTPPPPAPAPAHTPPVFSSAYSYSLPPSEYGRTAAPNPSSSSSSSSSGPGAEAQIQLQIQQLQQQLHQQQLQRQQQQQQQQQSQSQNQQAYGASAPRAPAHGAYNPSYTASVQQTISPPPPYSEIVYGQVLPNSRAATTSVPQQPAAAGPSIQTKVDRLLEMGFSRDKVINALQANNGDEEAALNSLLTSS